MVSPKTRQRLRHLLVRYRRPLAALCAASCVLLTITSLRPDTSVAGPDGSSGGGSAGAPGWTQTMADGLVAAPVRLADADVAALLRPGQVVDVLAADGKGRAVTVANSVAIIDIPAPSDAGLASTSFGGALIVLAVSSSQATELAAKAAVGPLSVVVRG